MCVWLRYVSNHKGPANHGRLGTLTPCGLLALCLAFFGAGPLVSYSHGAVGATSTFGRLQRALCGPFLLSAQEQFRFRKKVRE